MDIIKCSKGVKLVTLFVSLSANAALLLFLVHDQIVVRRSASCTCMADLGLRNFYDIAFEKLR